MRYPIVNAPAVQLKDISKCHLIYDRPEDRLKQIIYPRVQRLLGREPKMYFKEFWALRDISLDIHRGETIGIIGRNGAGKSTLLQVLCGTLCPSKGQVQTFGRVAALLELGSGFNVEFSGRENVYVNATVLGLNQGQIKERFEDIAAFADIGDFIDQPVKTYSSGMLVRLAFAVIAHVDADILVIDEALAVGDAIFTQKCMRFLRRFKEQGTLIFVSHDSHSVISLCDRALWLDHGTARQIGAAKEVAEAYMQFSLQETYGTGVELKNNIQEPKVNKYQPTQVETTVANTQIPAEQQPTITLFNNLDESTGWQTGAARIINAQLSCIGKPLNSILRGGDIVELLVEVDINLAIESPIIGFLVKDRLGQSLFGENTFEVSDSVKSAQPGNRVSARFEFQLPILPSGNYSITVAIAEGTPAQNVQHHWIHDAIVFNVVAPKPWLGMMGIPFRSITFIKQDILRGEHHA